jgi:polyribonucleotide nucleotidyltransferase
MHAQKFTAEIGGRTLTIETGHLAEQANGACTVRYGDTVVLATAVMSKETREGIDFFPLLVDYEERLYAAGKIKGSRFVKREGRPSDEAILTARVTDRSVRPLFDQSMRNDVQVVITVLSWDGENDPDILSLVGASCALAMSSVPWQGPIGAVRVGRINGEWVLNPTYAARDKSDIDLILAATPERHVMIEALAHELQEEDVLAALDFGHKHARKVIALIEDVVKAVGQAKIAFDTVTETTEQKAAREKLTAKVAAFTAGKLAQVWKTTDKHQREHTIDRLEAELDLKLKEDNEVGKEERAEGLKVLEELLDAEARRLVLEEDRRVDGRALDEVRPLSAAVGVLPRTHGSGLFQRGETQVLSITTLGSPGDQQLLEGIEDTAHKRYMHHYNFPAFSTGEVKPVRSPGRREIGHGALAEKALVPVLPPKEDFPYTIRVVSEVLSSNGSTSQASICGSTLSLMDAGVPIKAPVAGIAMGLITDAKTGKSKILTDIQGVEDQSGDMDYKVAGTKNGITAIQLDIKLDGIPPEVSKDALAGAKVARMKILQTMSEALPEPRPELSPYAPRITAIRIPVDKIRDVIGKGGETINKIIEECGGIDVTKIDIEDDGLVMVTSTDAELSAKAIQWIKDITRDVEVGEVYEGTVVQIQTDRNTGGEIGAIVELFPGHDGMVHISEFSDARIPTVSALGIKPGDKLTVKVMAVDKERGRVSLSVKAIAPMPYNGPAMPEAPHRGFNNRHGGFDRGPRGGFGDRRGPRRGHGGGFGGGRPF